MMALAHSSPGPQLGRAGLPAGCGWQRRASLPALWALIGYVHAYGAAPTVLLAAVGLAAGLGAAILLVAEDDTRWSSVLAAAMLLTSPLLQQYWAMAHEEPHWGGLMLLRAVVIVGGLLLLARLGAERPQQVD